MSLGKTVQRAYVTSSPYTHVYTTKVARKTLYHIPLNLHNIILMLMRAGEVATKTVNHPFEFIAIMGARILFLPALITLFLLRKRIKKIRFFNRGFERMKINRKKLENFIHHSLYLEIMVPKNAEVKAFEIQQKIFKTLHSIYTDPIENTPALTNWILFRKVWRLLRVKFSEQSFFNLQIFAEHSHITLRLVIPVNLYDRIEKALYNAYPGAEIQILDKNTFMSWINQYPDSYITYGESIIQGKFYHRIKTFKDVSSDPVDAVIATMESLKEGQCMAYNLFITPTSHFFNQIIHHLLEDEEKRQGLPDEDKSTKQRESHTSDLLVQLRSAMVEKSKATLFQTIISYWTIMPTRQEAEDKLANIQSALGQTNQKNMNTLKHKRLFTRQIKELIPTNKGGDPTTKQTKKHNTELDTFTRLRPVVKYSTFSHWPFCFIPTHTNHGQIVSDAELYALWHLPNVSADTVSSVKTVLFKKLPPTHAMKQFKNNFFISLGNSNFRMQEDTPIGIPTWDDAKKHLYILGGTGSGKSETLKTILASILHKEGDQKTACLIIDPKNDFATDLLTMIPETRKNDVVYFNPARQQLRPLSFPFFSQFSGAKTNDDRLDFLISIMRRFVQIDSIHSWGPELENILRQLFATAYVLPEQSLSGLSMLLHEPKQINNLLKYLPSRLQQFWMGSILKRTSNDLQKYLATTNNKIGKFLDYAEFLNITDRLDTKITFEHMINEQKIFIANLGSSSEQLKKYYSVYLSAHIAEAIFGQSRRSAQNRKPAVFVVDEFQRVASDIFEVLFSEVRAFNTALIVSNQFMGQLETKIQKSIESNIATKIFMRTQSIDDVQIAEKILGKKVTASDIISLPTGSAYIKTLVNGIPQEPMSIAIHRTHHRTENIDRIEEEFLQHTMEMYGTPINDIRTKRDGINDRFYTSRCEPEFEESMKAHIRAKNKTPSAEEPLPTIEMVQMIESYQTMEMKESAPTPLNAVIIQDDPNVDATNRPAIAEIVQEEIDVELPVEPETKIDFKADGNNDRSSEDESPLDLHF